MTLGVLPVSLQLPPEYGFPPAASTAQATATTGAANSATTPQDIVSISNTWDAGTFTAATGDIYRLSNLFNGTAPTGQEVAGYRVALGDGSGTLQLNGTDVTDRTTFTAAEFAKLTYAAGDSGSQQGIVAVAQLGVPDAKGVLTHVVDSPAMQITADVTGSRSINAINALVNPPAGAVGAMADVVAESGIFVGLGAGRPTVRTVGNFDATTGDVYRMGALFAASAPKSQTIQAYRVALGEGDGKLYLDGNDVTGQTSFTADEFKKLTFAAGSSGPQDIVVAAQTGTKLPDGSLTHIVDSTALQITANVDGTHSSNALNALTTPLSASDANIAQVIGESGIFTGLGSGRPTLQTDGNFSAASNDTYRMGDLFHASAPSGQTIAGYLVALAGDSGKLLLDSKDVTNQVSFTADEFRRLTYVTGDSGSQQSMVVVAQTGTRQSDGSLTRVVDSQPLQITADITGTRSINALNALATTPTGADASVAEIATEAGIFAGLGAGRPALATVGNFSAVAADTYRLNELFSAKAPSGQSIAGYRVALGDGGGALYLNGDLVSDQTSFTPSEFAKLTYVAGDAGSQGILVVAQTGTRQKDGSLSHVVDSPAVQITANSGASRSINAMSALATSLSGNAADMVDAVHEAGVFTGLGAGRPALKTDGNFNAVAGDVYRLDSLFHASAPSGQQIAGYRVVLDDGAGQLLLNGSPVAVQTSFTAAEFARLTYQAAGDTGAQQNLLVVAQTGTRLPDNTLTHVVDSPAVQITATVAASRSINVLNALTTPLADSAAAFAEVVTEAGIFTGFGQGRPTMRSELTAQPAVALEALASLTGAYITAGAAQAAGDLSQLYPGETAGYTVPGSYTDAGSAALAALQMLGGSAVGAYRTAGGLAMQIAALQAYNIASAL